MYQFKSHKDWCTFLLVSTPCNIYDEILKNEVSIQLESVLYICMGWTTLCTELSVQSNRTANLRFGTDPWVNIMYTRIPSSVPCKKWSIQCCLELLIHLDLAHSRNCRRLSEHFISKHNMWVSTQQAMPDWSSSEVLHTCNCCLVPWYQYTHLTLCSSTGRKPARIFISKHNLRAFKAGIRKTKCFTQIYTEHNTAMQLEHQQWAFHLGFFIRPI